MKILIIANYAKEHINKFHVSTIKRFKELGWEVDVACKADADVEYCDNLYNLPMERNPFRIQSFSAIRQLRNIIKKNKYDVIHCHTLAGKVIGILAAKDFRRKGLKIVYSAHGFQYYKGATPIEWAFVILDKFLVRNVDVLITANSEDFDNAKRFHFKAKHILQCCGVGVKLDKFRSMGKEKSIVRKELGLSDKDIVLIYVAELNRNKNQKMLLKMFSVLDKKIPDLHMLLVGPDHYNGRIQNLINKHNLSKKIYCLGWRSDVPDLIKASDFAVASSIREGFGLNIVEYMACNIPVVAVDNRGHRETIVNGKTGYIVPQNDYKMMAKQVLRLYKRPKEKLKIVKTAADNLYNFEDETIVSRLVEIYQKYIVNKTEKRETI